MLFVTLNQQWIFLIILWYGAIVGILCKLGQIVCKSIATRHNNTKHSTRNKITKKRNFAIKNSKKHQKTHKKRNFFNIFGKNAVDFVSAIMVCTVFIVINYCYNYGEIRLFTILSYGVGFALGRFVLACFWKLVSKIKIGKNRCVDTSETIVS